MYVYNTSPPANVTTNGTINTDQDHLRLLTVAGTIALVRALYLKGKGGGLTAISGIEASLKRFGTASTAGAAIVPAPTDARSPAAALTPFTGPTIGATPTIALSISCGATGPGAWVAQDFDDVIQLVAGGGANGNLDLISQSATISLNFGYSLRHME
jgi:hypothetical protein